MKRWFAASAGIVMMAAALSGCVVAPSRPRPSYYASPPPVYAPPPVYVAPRPVYAPRPVIIVRPPPRPFPPRPRPPGGPGGYRPPPPKPNWQPNNP